MSVVGFAFCQSKIPKIEKCAMNHVGEVEY